MRPPSPIDVFLALHQRDAISPLPNAYNTAPRVPTLTIGAPEKVIQTFSGLPFNQGVMGATFARHRCHHRRHVRLCY